MVFMSHFQEYPPIKQLPVHLENEQRITFRPDSSYNLANLEETVADTPLMGFFKANREYAAARELYYADFPTKFVWNTKSFEWLPRKKQTVYGRLV